jgi:hypothetical protein
MPSLKVIQHPDKLKYGFLHGMRPGEKLHLFLAPGGCNASVIQNIIIPDYLPPSFTALERVDSSVLSQEVTQIQNRDVCSRALPHFGRAAINVLALMHRKL